MAIQHIDSFDLYGDNTDILAAGYSFAEGSVSTGTGRFGGNCYSLEVTSNNVLALNFTYAAYVTLSFWYKQDSVTLAFADIVNIGDGISSNYGAGNVSVGISLQADGALDLEGDGGVSKAVSATGVISPQTWHHIELQVYLNDAGTAVLTVDGIEVINTSGDFLESTIRNFLMFTGSANTNLIDCVVYQDDATGYPALLGEHKIHVLLPNAATAQADWTGAYTDIDDPAGAGADGDTTYINATTLNDKSEFALSDLPESPTTVYAVKSTIDASKTDAGTIGVTHHIDSNGTEETGTEFAPADSVYASHSAIHELNPDGSVAWTETSVNALLIGVEITT